MLHLRYNVHRANFYSSQEKNTVYIQNLHVISNPSVLKILKLVVILRSNVSTGKVNAKDFGFGIIPGLHVTHPHNNTHHRKNCPVYLHVNWCQSVLGIYACNVREWYTPGYSARGGQSNSNAKKRVHTYSKCLLQ